jgi:hypothetical protein
MARNKERKWQTRFYILPTKTIDLLPLRWKYKALNTPSGSILDRHSYAVKWLFLELHFERVRMNLRQ